MDVCGLISKEEMAEIAGVEVTDARFEMSGDVSVCGYEAPHHGVIHLEYGPNSRSLVDSPLFKDTEDVPGLGEKARWFPGQAGLHVAVGGQAVLSVMLGASSVKLRGGDLRGLAIDIAKAAVPRLPH